jgi:carboxymethylenebutenolidase
MATNPGNQHISESLESYRSGRISRRELLQSIIAVTGSYTAAHLFLERTGLAATLISTIEAQNANVDAETVKYLSGRFEITAYLAKPRGAGKHPGVIVIHENRGLNENIRDVTRRFAAEGFIALAPDLLSRVGGTGTSTRSRPAGPVDAADESGRTGGDVTEAIASLPLYGAIDDLKAGFEFLEKNPAVEPTHISTVGFCWGGWRSFTLATVLPKLSKTVVFYGSSPDAGFEKIQSPVLAHYAEADTRITGNALWTKKMMDSASKKFQYYIYPKTDHAFFNDTGNRYNPDASKLAWQRTLEFLRS